jgi:hypothetical protein
MHSLLANITPDDVIAEPFPHIIIKDALDQDLYLKLASELPSIHTIKQGKENKSKGLASNRRLNYLATDVFKDESISSLWKEFIALHTSETFLQRLISIFQESILRIYPDFEQKYGSFTTLRSGIRRQDTFETADVLLDALICTNTPVVTKPTSVRRAHIDRPDKLFAGLFYMRSPEDDSTGGDLELYRFKRKPYGFRRYEIPDKYVSYVKTVKYDSNVLVLFLNSISSLHGVTVRSLTQHPRYFVNLVGEVREPFFDVFQYQESPFVRYLDWQETRKVLQDIKLNAKKLISPGHSDRQPANELDY